MLMMEFLMYYIVLIYSLVRRILLFPWYQASTTKVHEHLHLSSTTSLQAWISSESYHDAINGVDEWVRENPSSYYDWNNLKSLKRDLVNSRRCGDYLALCSQLRAQSSRNICWILTPKLYQKSTIQTKFLIQEYVREVRRCVRFVALQKISPDALTAITGQERLQLLHDMRQTLGRTSLILQGGAAVSLCHLGVARTLLENRVLPHIITGTATGALIAALIGITRTRDLPNVLDGKAIDLSAFEQDRIRKENSTTSLFWPRWMSTIWRRLRRYIILGHVFNIDVFHQCVRDNIGDITFEEAYERTGRVLNITIAMSDSAGTPQLLNYITAPHVLISSAVVASIATSRQMYASVQLYCKTETGVIARYVAADESRSHHHYRRKSQQQAPMQRIGELFNVNHFIVSQTRPYIIPFIRIQRWADQYFLIGKLLRIFLSEGRHWVEVLGRAGFLPGFLLRALVDEVVPNFAPWAKLTILPRIEIQDCFKIFNTPNEDSIRNWSLRGEQSVWPLLCEIKIRCAVEFELEDCYSRVRRPGIPIGE